MCDPVEKDLPVINCHTHIFTGDCVPPWLAKTFLPWPIYYLLNVRWVIAGFRWWKQFYRNNNFTTTAKKRQRFLYKTKIFITRNILLTTLFALIEVAVTLNVFYFLWNMLATPANTTGSTNYIDAFAAWMKRLQYPLPVQNVWINIVSIIVLVLFFRSGRNFILFIFKRSFRLLKMLPGPKTTELIKRYINLGMFAFLNQQVRVFGMLCRQYPPNTQFIVLPMDMEFMEGGRIPKSYYTQMQELAAIKKGSLGAQIIPFVFVDPRRIEKDPNFFRYQVINGKVVLEDCIIRDYIEKEKFAGFKIYPALGYYPFDEKLLPLWKYAADNGLPVMTHCIRGTIYYRGKKHAGWDQHPVFEQDMGTGKDPLPLLLPQKKNIEFTVNFTHPMNCLCLVEKLLLYKIVSNSPDLQLHRAFGYDKDTRVMQYDLCNLKICLGHFGGEDEWKKFFELDRSNFADDVINKPTFGINFLYTNKGKRSIAITEQVWKYADWYSIICSMMLQYPGIYADLSYILHDGDGVFPLLKLALQNPGLRNRILYGTDFYVVRNHKSDKNLRADILSALTKTEFNQIAHSNPHDYLYNIPVCKRMTIPEPEREAAADAVPQ